MVNMSRCGRDSDTIIPIWIGEGDNSKSIVE